MISVPQNFYKETVAVAWGAGAGNFYVSTKPTASVGYLVISPNNESLREIVKFTATGTDGTGDYVTITAENRGLGGTTAQSHSIGEAVYMNVTAENVQEIIDELEDLRTEIAEAVAAGASYATDEIVGIARLSTDPTTSIGTATISIATPAVVTRAAHGLIAGDKIEFTTTGALPTGITASTPYYVLSSGLTTDTFQISATIGGSAVNTSGSQSGTHTLIRLTAVAVGDNDPRFPSADLQAAQAGGGVFGSPATGNKFLTETYKSNLFRVDVFTASGTWNKPAGATFCEIFVIGAGGGGGSGGVRTTGSSHGGAGGGGGGISILKVPASILGATETVTTGAGGAGGAAVTANSALVGNVGSPGGNSSFGSVLSANGGNGGAAGTSSAPAGGTGGVGMTFTGSAGGLGGTGTGGGSNGVDSIIGPTGGGGGGGSQGSIELNGYTGGAITPYRTRAGGVGGVASGTPTAGSVGNAPTGGEFTGGTGGGGGAGQLNANATDGGPGAAGGGGGGGGSVYSGGGSFTTGAGGRGGDGMVVVITYF